jgi:hypothetical protein
MACQHAYSSLCHLVCQWAECRERKISAARSLSSLYPSNGATIENDSRFFRDFFLIFKSKP